MIIDVKVKADVWIIRFTKQRYRIEQPHKELQ